MNNVPNLREIERRETYLIIRWDDETEFVITYESLRFWCPCANCKPRRSDMGRRESLRDEISRLRNEKPKAEMVGSYGLRFTFASGCNSGIFSVDRLHAIATGEPDPDTL